MQKVYPNRINWENEPSQNTPINENNLNKMDYALFTIDGRVCDLELTKANQSDLLLGVKNVDYNTSTGVFTFEWQNGTRKTVDLNIEKIPVSFSLDADGVIRMKTADGTIFTADISQALKQYNFVDSSVIDFTESVDGEGNKVVTADIIGGSITAEKLQPNFLADCTEAKETAETKALVSEGYAVGEQNGVPVDETSPYYHNNAKYFSDKSASTIYQQSNWNETDQTQSAYIHNKPFNSLDQNDFEVVNGILKTKSKPLSSGDGIEIVNGAITADDTIARKIEIPTSTSQLTNDSDFVEDANYEHVDEAKVASWGFSKGGGDGEHIDILQADYDALTEAEKNDPNKYYFITDGENGLADTSIVSDKWTSRTYNVGEYCIDNNTLWKCLVQNSERPSDGANWTRTSVGDEIENINSLSDVKVGSLTASNANDFAVAVFDKLKTNDFYRSKMLNFTGTWSGHFDVMGFVRFSSLTYCNIVYLDVNGGNIYMGYINNGTANIKIK